MKENSQYPFYKSLRFRFGLFFGFLFFIVLMAFVVVLYKKIQHELERGFEDRLAAGAGLVLQKTSVSPLVLPLPQAHESFTLIYNDGRRNDTLYSNINTRFLRSIQTSKTLETGGQLRIQYALPDGQLLQSLASWQRLLFIYLPLAFLCSLLLGYTLSGVLLRPIRQLIAKASSINLQSDIQLLPRPATADELHQLTEALNRMLERIKHQLAEQNAFFASASHELRTPLSTMLTELQVIEAATLSQDMQTVVQNQKAEVKRLIKLVNDFLLMSQLKADALKPQKAPVDLLELCMSVVARAQAKGQHFRLSALPEEEDFLVYADKQQLESILTNLVDNAVKYGRKESVVNVELTNEADTIRLLLRNETDTLIESPSQLGREFYREGFYQQGFGLGLWIVRQLVEKNGGTIHIRNEHHQFVVEIDFVK